MMNREDDKEMCCLINPDISETGECPRRAVFGIGKTNLFGLFDITYSCADCLAEMLPESGVTYSVWRL